MCDRLPAGGGELVASGVMVRTAFGKTVFESLSLSGLSTGAGKGGGVLERGGLNRAFTFSKKSFTFSRRSKRWGNEVFIA
jgi:hypothetical protein